MLIPGSIRPVRFGLAGTVPAEIPIRAETLFYANVRVLSQLVGWRRVDLKYLVACDIYLVLTCYLLDTWRFVFQNRRWWYCWNYQYLYVLLVGSNFCVVSFNYSFHSSNFCLNIFGFRLSFKCIKRSFQRFTTIRLQKCWRISSVDRVVVRLISDKVIGDIRH